MSLSDYNNFKPFLKDVARTVSLPDASGTRDGVNQSQKRIGELFLDVVQSENRAEKNMAFIKMIGFLKKQKQGGSSNGIR